MQKIKEHLQVLFHSVVVTIKWLTCERTLKEQGLMASSYIHWLLLIHSSLTSTPPMQPVPFRITPYPHQAPPHLASAPAAAWCHDPSSLLYMPLQCSFPISLPLKINCSLFCNLKHWVKTHQFAHSCTVLWLVYATRLNSFKAQINPFIIHVIDAWISDKI